MPQSVLSSTRQVPGPWKAVSIAPITGLSTRPCSQRWPPSPLGAAPMHQGMSVIGLGQGLSPCDFQGLSKANTQSPLELQKSLFLRENDGVDLHSCPLCLTTWGTQDALSCKGNATKPGWGYTSRSDPLWPASSSCWVTHKIHETLLLISGTTDSARR